MTITSSELVQAAKSCIREIDLAAFDAMCGNETVAVLDVRDSSEFANGHIPGAVHAQRGMLEFYLDRGCDSFLAALAGKTRLITVCGSGDRAALAARLAQQMGWDACSLRGGMRAWRADHREISAGC